MMFRNVTVEPSDFNFSLAQLSVLAFDLSVFMATWPTDLNRVEVRSQPTIHDTLSRMEVAPEVHLKCT